MMTYADAAAEISFDSSSLISRVRSDLVNQTRKEQVSVAFTVVDLLSYLSSLIQDEVDSCVYCLVRRFNDCIFPHCYREEGKSLTGRHQSFV